MVTSTKTLSPAEKAKAALAYAEAKALEAEWADFNAKEELFRKWRRGLPRVEPTHGKVNTYKSHRCRCDECKRAMSEYMKDYNKRKGISKPPRTPILRTDRLKDKHHGTHTGYVYGCRCDPCKDAHRRAKPVSNIKHGTRWAYEKRGCRCPSCVSAVRRAWRKQKNRKPRQKLKHGSRPMYDTKKCRCDKCVKFMRALWKQERDKKRGSR